jgi:SAM-dependent methyltransferase
MGNKNNSGAPRLYSEFATWFHLLTAPEDYAEEADIYYRTIISACESPPHTMLELGSGGGNNASHLKGYLKLTLVDLSSDMLAISEKLNPECEHILGDMRDLHLGRLFDAVFIHDAIMYMTNEDDLRRAFKTAYLHCRPGGAALFAPDHVRETFRPTTEHGGHDDQLRGLRYLDWSWDPDPMDTTYISDMVYLLKMGDGQVKVEHDRHILGIFPRQTWLILLRETGFHPEVIPFEHSQIDPGSCEMFIGRKIHHPNHTKEKQ